MERFKGSLAFWALLIVALVPAIMYGQTLKKSQKCLFGATVDGVKPTTAQLVRTT